MALVVMKFGGSSVADKECLERVAGIIADSRREGNDVVAVLSAQGGMTDSLLKKAQEIGCTAAGRDMDMLITAGEQISVALMAMELEKMGVPACPRLGWQLGIRTDSAFGSAEITEVDVEGIKGMLDTGRVVIAAGFQGVDGNGEITSLGRGGSDTTAVVLAAALGADRCLIYTDVDGVYSADPKTDTTAGKLDRISWDEMLYMAEHGAKVLHAEAVRAARKYGIAIRVLSSFVRSEGTLVAG